MSPGPLFGSRPSANTAGKIARPARSPENVSPNVVHPALVVRLSSSLRYEPYTTMNVPPSESENTAWPMAAIITRGVRSDSSNLRMYHSSPAHAFGSVSARTMSTPRITQSRGMTIRLARSMPLRNPRRSTKTHDNVTAAVHTSCRESDCAESPVSGGRIRDASTAPPPARTSSPTA